MIDVALGASLANTARLTTQPVAFDGLFGWFSPGVTRRGVILCGTLGYEQHCAHRSWRELAERIAAAGCPTLRFDYLGEGDSADHGSGRLDGLLDAIRRAIRFMRDGGAEEIVLVGLRLGGTLAALVAAEGGVDRLVLLAPFTTGRAYLRETRLQARAINLLPDGTPMPEEPGVLTVSGFCVDPGLADDLLGIDLIADTRPLPPRVLFLGPNAGALSARCTLTGSVVETEAFPELGRLIWGTLHARIAAATLSRVVEFVAAEASMAPVGLGLAQPNAALESAHWREEAVRFGEALFGIACRPRCALQTLPTVLFVNLGADVHSGCGRQTTNLARALARVGIGSLRMDLAGVGDSPDRPDGGLPLYTLDAVDDVRAAIDYLVDAHAGPIIAVGTCNGAYLAFHTLCQDHRLAGAVLVNLYCFDWDLKHDGVPFGAQPVRSTAMYVGLLKKSASWRRVLRGETPVLAIVTGLARRYLSRAALWVKRGMRAGGSRRSIASRVKDLRLRGARLLLIYSAGDLGLADVRLHLGGSIDRASSLVGEPIRIVPGTDHSFSSKTAQSELLRVVCDFFETTRVNDVDHLEITSANQR